MRQNITFVSLLLGFLLFAGYMDINYIKPHHKEQKRRRIEEQKRIIREAIIEAGASHT